MLEKRRYEGGIQIPITKNLNGLYLLGSTHFNPHTHEEFYWIKIGASQNLKSRLKSYSCENPMIWRVDFIECSLTEEEDYQNRLYEIGIEKANLTEEWVRVTRKDYLDICDKGFNFFN